MTWDLPVGFHQDSLSVGSLDFNKNQHNQLKQKVENIRMKPRPCLRMGLKLCTRHSLCSTLCLFTPVFMVEKMAEQTPVFISHALKIST